MQRFRRFIPLAIFLTLTLASVLAAGFAWQAAEEAGRIKFEAAADDAVGRITVRIEQHISLLRATLAFFEARNGEVSRASFRTFVDTLDIGERSPGLQGIGFAAFLPTGEEETAEAYIRAQFRTPVAVWPETDQERRAVITLLEPLNQQNQDAIGYDMFSDPVRRAAMTAAIESGEARASGRVQLVQESQGRAQAGFLVYLPFNIPGSALQTASISRAAPQGFIYAPFRAGELFNSALGRAPLIPVTVEVYDGKVDSDNLLFRSETPPAHEFGVHFAAQREMIVAGRPWIVRFQPTSAFTEPTSPGIPLAIGLAGIMLAGALGWGAWLQNRAYEAATALHIASEKSLLEKDLMLQEMKHRIKNSIARMLAIARQTAVGASSIDEFSASFGARLQAMAASQDMLTRSRWQKADLCELLRTELEQVFGDSLDLARLNGPPVQLDEAATQALGLTFHELATNALKYGEVGSGLGSLTVTWDVEARRPSRLLRLVWTESSSVPVHEPERKGFGTRLIDANITRELRGSITRTFGEQGLTIEIIVPLN